MKKVFSSIRDNHDSIFKLLLFFLTLFIIVYFFPRQINFEYEYSKGKPWMQETIITSFDFPIFKTEEELQKENLTKSKDVAVKSELKKEKLKTLTNFQS